MGSSKALYSLFVLCLCVSNIYQCLASELETRRTAVLRVNGSEASGQPISDNFLGIFFEEINHAGMGGIWAELVSNRGFEAGGQNTPSNIDPWSKIGDDSSLIVSTDRSSCFDRNKIALRMDVLCDSSGENMCPADGVGVYNPGFWGMNVEEGKTYRVVLYVRSSGAINVSVALTGSDGLQKLAAQNIVMFYSCAELASEVSDWKKVEFLLEAEGSNSKSRLQLTTTTRGVIWFDQVSVMPLDTYKGHGFRTDLIKMLEGLKPRFLRFPGGCFVEGSWLRNAFRWKESVGPWEERSGHFNDVWGYWTDDGIGYFEFLQLAEDVGAQPVWVFNNGISHNDEVSTKTVLPFVQEALDGIEFARGDASSKWGSLRAKMGHPEPFDLKYVSIGNEDCNKRNYRGNYVKFYEAIKSAYPDILIITNCDATAQKLDHPADLFDHHIYTSSGEIFNRGHYFDNKPRNGPKAFVSEYAVTGKDAGKGSFLAALGEAGFLIGLERNSDLIEMVSYAPLFVNANDRRWNPDAIVFDSSQVYGTPSYWVQKLFTETSGATFLKSTLEIRSYNSILASAIYWKSSEDDRTYLRIKVVNYGGDLVSLKILVDGLDPNDVRLSGATKTEFTSTNLMDENSFNEPTKVTPTQIRLKTAGEDFDVTLLPRSITSIDLLKETSSIKMPGTGSVSRSSIKHE